MEDKIKQILEELYLLDPELRQQETQLAELVKVLLAARPNLVPDQQFVQELRLSLQKAESQPPAAPVRNWRQYWPLALGLAGTVVLLLIINPLVNQPGRQLKSLTQNFKQQALSGQAKITTVAPHAFGSLAVATTEEYNKAAAPAGRGVSDNATITSLAAPQASQMIKVLPPIATSHLVYRGQALTLADSQLPVFRRVKNQQNGSLVAQALSKINFGLFAFSKLTQPTVQNLTLAEQKNKGYLVSINLNEESLSINKDYGAWPQPLTVAENSSAPAWQEAAVIKLANDFTQRLALNLKSYGQPELDYSWRSNATSDYVPEVLQVIYPQLLNGQLVLDEGGNSKAGARVSVNLRQQEVEGIWNLTTNNYESSDYEALQDFAAAVKIAEAGGWRQQWWYGNGQAEVTLGTPTRQLLKITNYQNGQSEELIVPALVFPVEQTKQNYFYRSTVVVPLIKELLDNDTTSGPVRIMTAPAVK